MIAGVIRLIHAHEKVCHLWASSQHWHSILASDTAGIPLCCYAARGLFGRCAAKKGNVSNLNTEECFSLGWQGFLPSI